MTSSRDPALEGGRTEDARMGWSEGDTHEQSAVLCQNGSLTAGNRAPHLLPLRFVDGLDKTYSRETRVHIARRKADGKRNKRFSTRDSRRKPAETESGQSTAATDPTAIVPSLRTESSSPVILLSQARADPFDTLALHLTSTEQFYLDQYIGLSSIYKLSRNSRYHPPRDIIFPASKGAAPALLAMMTCAARGLVNQTTSTVHEEHFLKFRTMAINAVGQELSKTEGLPSDGLIIGVCGLLATELEMVPKMKPPETEGYISAHIEGLRAMIRSHGGFTKACMLSSINWLLHWEDLFTGGELSAGMTPLSAYVTQAPARFRLPRSPAEVPSLLYPAPADFRSPAEELSGAYGAFFREARNRRLEARLRVGTPCESLGGSPEYDDGISPTPIGTPNDPYTFFRPGTPIRRLLSDPSAWYTLPPVGPLLYLNMLLYEYRGAAAAQSLTNGYFPRLCKEMEVEGLDVNGTVEMLMWALMRDPSKSARSILDPERVWIVTRMLRLLKKVDKTFRMRLERALYSFLRAGDPEKAFMAQMELEPDFGGEGEAGEPVWEPEMFRAALLTGLGMVDQVGTNMRQDDINVGIADEEDA